MKLIYTGFEGPWANHTVDFSMEGPVVADYLTEGFSYIDAVFADDTTGNVIAPGASEATHIENKASLKLDYSAGANTVSTSTSRGTRILNTTAGRVYLELKPSAVASGFSCNYYMSVDATDTVDRVIASFINKGDIYQIQFTNSQIKVFRSVGGGSYAIYASTTGLSFTGTTQQRIKISITELGMNCNVSIGTTSLTFNLGGAPTTTVITKCYVGVDHGTLDDISVNNVTGGIDTGAPEDVKYVMVPNADIVGNQTVFVRASDTFYTAYDLKDYLKGKPIKSVSTLDDWNSGIVEEVAVSGDFIGQSLTNATSVSALIAGTPTNVATINTHYMGLHLVDNYNHVLQSDIDTVVNTLPLSSGIVPATKVVSNYYKSNGTTPYSVSDTNQAILKFQKV